MIQKHNYQTEVIFGDEFSGPLLSVDLFLWSKTYLAIYASSVKDRRGSYDGPLPFSRCCLLHDTWFKRVVVLRVEELEMRVELGLPELIRGPEEDDGKQTSNSVWYSTPERCLRRGWGGTLLVWTVTFLIFWWGKVAVLQVCTEADGASRQGEINSEYSDSNWITLEKSGLILGFFSQQDSKSFFLQKLNETINTITLKCF